MVILLDRHVKAFNRSAVALVLICLGACGRRTDAASGPGPVDRTPTEASYLDPPRATSATLGAGGMLHVSGSAPPRSVVEITSPEGETARVSASRSGSWDVRLPATAAPRLYAISALIAGRTVHAEGALVTAPGALTRAVTVRAGYAARPLERRAHTDIAAVDYDPAGFIAVAGSAPPNADLALAVDGSTAAVSHADGQGGYALLAANRRLAMGRHLLQVHTPDSLAERLVTLEPPSPLTAPYRAWPGPDGWRVEWALTGGGVQTTLILAR